MELINKTTIGNKTLSIVDVAGCNGGNGYFPRLIRVVETEGDYIRSNSKNVICNHFGIRYNGNSKKQRNEALAEAIKVFEETLGEIAAANPIKNHK